MQFFDLGQKMYALMTIGQVNHVPTIAFAPAGSIRTGLRGSEARRRFAIFGAPPSSGTPRWGIIRA